MAADAAAALFDMNGTRVNTPDPHALARWKTVRKHGHQVPTHPGVGVR
ncbi:hypothetical protein [Kitasatospora griseola]